MEHKNIYLENNFINSNLLYWNLFDMLEDWQGTLSEAIEYVLDSGVVSNIINDEKFNYSLIKDYSNEAIRNNTKESLSTTKEMHYFVTKYILTNYIYTKITETLIYNMLIDYINKNRLEYSEHFIEMIAINIDYDNKWQKESKRLVKNLLTL